MQAILPPPISFGHALEEDREQARSYHSFQPARQSTIPMLIVHVHIQVKPECVEAFKAATLANARASVQEPGVARFDVCQQADDPTRFVLVEVYRTPEAPAAHKTTAHYAAWRVAADPMMAATRTSVKFANVFPEDRGW